MSQSSCVQVCCLKYPYSCFSAHFCLLIFCFTFCPYLFLLILLLPVAAFSFFGGGVYSLLFCIFFALFVYLFVCFLILFTFSFLCILQIPELLYPQSVWTLFLLIFFSHRFCLYHLIVINSLVLWSVGQSSSFIHFNGPKYLTTGTAQMLIPYIKFLPQSLVLRSFLVILRFWFGFMTYQPLWVI